MVERSLSMREALGSMPRFSTFDFSGDQAAAVKNEKHPGDVTFELACCGITCQQAPMV